MCFRTPSYANGNSMLSFDSEDPNLPPLMTLEPEEQMAVLHTGRWLCLYCWKSEHAKRAIAYQEKHGSDKARQEQKATHEKWKWIYQEMIKIGACSICGLKVTEDTTYKFEWDHVKHKYKAICQLATELADDKVIKKELKRCRLLCAECHRECTNSQFLQRRAFPSRVDADGRVIKRGKKRGPTATWEMQTYGLNKYMRTTE